VSATISAYSVGPVSLDLERRTLSGPRGEISLTTQIYLLAERLMRRRGAIVETSELISVIYPEPDDEPSTADVLLRMRLKQLRGALDAVSPDSQNSVKLRNERGVGYVVK
jgi:DNA-binding response OmpR family regulator